MSRSRIRNCILGQAYGDSLGLSTEFLNREQINEYYGSEPITHNKFNDSHRSCWKKYDWTDDTDLSILVVRDMIEHKGFRAVTL